MPTFAGIICDELDGVPAYAARERITIWQRPGVDGTGVMTEGKGPVHFPLTINRRGSGAFIDTWIDAIMALSPGPHTVVDEFEKTHQQIWIENDGMPNPVVETIVTENAGTMEYQLKATFTIKCFKRHVP